MREMDVGERLGLDALRRVDDEDRALAGLEAVADLVGEVDVTGRVDEVEAVDRGRRCAVYSRRTARALIVMPFSRSRSIESRTWLVIWRASIVCVSSSNRSASVDLPWSMWAMIEKLRRRSWGMVTRPECSGSSGALGPSEASGLHGTRAPSHRRRRGRRRSTWTRPSRSPKSRNAATAAIAANWRAQDRGDRDALARAPGGRHRAEDLADAGDDEQRQRGTGQAQPAAQQQRQRRSRRPRRAARASATHAIGTSERRGPHRRPDRRRRCRAAPIDEQGTLARVTGRDRWGRRERGAGDRRAVHRGRRRPGRSRRRGRRPGPARARTARRPTAMTASDDSRRRG